MIDYRYDPFLNTSTAIYIMNELQVIPTSSPFTIRLSEVPVKDVPSSLTMRVRDILTAAITSITATSITVANGSWFTNGNIITVDSEKLQVTGVTTNTLTVARGYSGTVATTHTVGTPVYIESSMSEVSASPTKGQFWPDYSTKADNDDNWNTGTILFNSADAGKTVAVNYRGMGTLLDSRSLSHGKLLLTIRGKINWTVPPGASKVWVQLMGAGGSGGGSTAGSYDGSDGGSGQLIGVTEIAVIPNQVIPLTVGAGGLGVYHANGNAGEATSFGSYLTASPGGGGNYNGGNAGDSPPKILSSLCLEYQISGSYGKGGKGCNCNAVSTPGSDGYIYIEW